MTGDLVTLPPGMLDLLLPMHLILDADGIIRHAGPTLAKVAGQALDGLRFDRVFALRRPSDPATAADLLRHDGRLRLALAGPPAVALRGQAVALDEGGVLVNLSFGISVVEAIADRALTAADFAVTDLTVELLYLVEAKGAVMRESTRLNESLKVAKAAAETQALSDTLTGLGNRRAMAETLARLIARRAPFGLMHLDLDHFKAVNDTLGHAAGDHVLTVVAQALREATRAADLVARIGGDEFVLILNDSTDLAPLAELGHRLIAALERPIRWNRQTCRISGSVGVTSTALYARPDPDRMLSDADEALYASKHAGRGTVTLARSGDLAATG